MLPLLIDQIASATGNGVEIESNLTQCGKQILAVLDGLHFTSFNGDMKHAAGIRTGDERRKYHAFILVHHGKNHIEMNGRACFRHFHYDDMLDAAAGSEGLYQRIDALDRSAFAVADADDVVAENQYVASLDGEAGRLLHSSVEIESFSEALGMKFENVFHNDRFCDPHLICHRSGDHAVVHAHGGVAHEEEIRQRGQGIQTVAQIALKSVAFFQRSMNKSKRQLGVVELEQLFAQIGISRGRAEGVDEHGAGLRNGECFTQEIDQLIGLTYLIEHELKLIVLPQRPGKMENVVVEHFRCV